MDPEIVTRTIQWIIGFSVILNRPVFTSAVLTLFLASVAFLLVGSLYAVFDVYLSHSIFAHEIGQMISMDNSTGEKS